MISWANIVNNKLRSALTMLGIVIGVASIIALITIVQGATGAITDEISSLGANILTVQARGTPLKPGLSANDLDRLEAIADVRGVSPTISGYVSVSHRDKVLEAMVQGKNELYFRERPVQISAGRAINALDVDGANRVAVIGSDIARELFYGQNPLGRSLRIGGSTYTVVGLLAPSGGFALGSTNKAVFIPYTAAMKTLGVRTVSSVEVHMADVARADEIIGQVEAVLLESFNYREQAYSIFNMQDALDVMKDVTRILSLLLAGIASISLVVGGIGIMNMMLVSVTERTTEIGLRKALGAEPVQIQIQFLTESVILSLGGGLAGIVMGLLIACAGSWFIGIPFCFSATTVIAAVGFSAAVGVLFGWMPARKASRLNPIDALRHV